MPDDESTEQTDEQTGSSTTPDETDESDTSESSPPTDEPEPETFTATYVAGLRQEAAEHRTRAQRADDLGRRLHVALTAATGRLADPEDLPYDEAHLDDEDALTVAVDELLTRKPHLASRRPSGDVGQGASGGSGDVDLAGMLRGLAG